MSEPVPFEAYALRYYPNLISGEFVNVGIALVCPEANWWGVRLARKLTALNGLYPSAQPAALTVMLRGLQARLDAVSEPVRTGLRIPGDWSRPLSPVEAAIGRLDGSLRWSDQPVQGVTDDPSGELEYWFVQLVHVAREPASRTVLQPPGDATLKFQMRREFERRGILRRMRPAEVGTYMKEHFDYTFTNGRLHVFEVIRLSHTQARRIRSTAQMWRGKIDSLNDGADQRFSFYALIDRPEEPALVAEAETAAKVIENADAHQVKTFNTSEVEEFGEVAESVLAQ